MDPVWTQMKLYGIRPKRQTNMFQINATILREMFLYFTVFTNEDSHEEKSDRNIKYWRGHV